MYDALANRTSRLLAAVWVVAVVCVGAAMVAFGRYPAGVAVFVCGLTPPLVDWSRRRLLVRR